MSNSRMIRSLNATAGSRPTSVDINVLLLHPSNKRLQTRRLKDISTLDLEQRLCFEDLEAKAAALFKRPFRVNLSSESIEFYQPKELLTLDRVDEWKEQPATRGSNSFVEESLSLKTFTVGRQHIDPVVTGEIADEEAERLDTVSELPPNREFGGYDRYEKLLKTPFIPSHHAKSKERQSLQEKTETVIYDGTYVLNPLVTLETAAQPIEIFHPPFAELKRNLQDPVFGFAVDALGRESDGRACGHDLSGMGKDPKGPPAPAKPFAAGKPSWLRYPCVRSIRLATYQQRAGDTPVEGAQWGRLALHSVNPESQKMVS
ncbi:hypothetical protein PQX77_003455 [Marasmius sp. AFHP31]|nr:hypothetical protein PQX77_003455 [Marasmius sp. AFHP31]